MNFTTRHDLDTPSVLIDLDRMERNIRAMQDRCNALGIAFRPHTKTHKIPDIARKQLAAGAIGIACQKVTEAQVFADAGINDIQIPYNIVGPHKTARLVDLALYNRVTVSVDHPLVVAGLADAAAPEDVTIRVLVDLATHIRRTGAEPHELVTLAQRIEAEERLHFAGVLVYPSDPEIRPALQETLNLLDAAGIGVDVVSGGGSGAAHHAHEMPELTELRVGTYVFNDYSCVVKGWATLDDCAMTVAATVVSRPTPDRVILDAGSKTLSSDRVRYGSGYEGESATEGFGHIVEYPGARIYQLSEEHGHCDFSACAERPVIGERIHIIPVHACVVTNLHNTIYGVRGDQIEEEWPVAARGRVW
jgi:D-serine deaminase-like pyridoxal phosphate-dependent protein